MGKYLWLLDNGHGGVIDGVPQTAGKRSPDFGDGVLYEGVSNRAILAKVKQLLDDACIDNIVIVPEVKDISLGERVRRVNSLDGSSNKCIFLSFHSDAFRLESANGWSAFTTPKKTKSDKVADVLYKHAKNHKFKLRTDYSDGDPDKEANFYVLKNTTCPAVLIENFFMTNEKDHDFIRSEKGQDKIAKVIFNSIKEIEKNGI